MSLPVREQDLNSAARIRNAALECFATSGIADTSIRDVAKAAGASAGLVQHHFKTKASLRDAVSEYVTEMVVEAFSDASDLEEEDDPIQAAGDLITDFVATNPYALRYIGRALVEEDATANRVFDAFVDVILANLKRLAGERRLHEDLDLEWAAIHLVSFNLATLLFEQGLNRRLPAPLFSAGELRRWNVATTELYRRGMFRPPAE